MHAALSPKHCKHWAALLLNAALMCALPALQADPLLPAEEYALFSALLRHGLDPAAKQAVIANTTTGDPARIVSSGPPSEARAKELNTSRELLREWSRLNQRTFTLTADFKLPMPMVLFTEADRDLLFRGDEPVAGWKLFFERYAGSSGLIRLSRAAFDLGSAHALVYLEFQCGPECGSGRLVHMTRAPAGGWQVEGGELIWIAGPKP
jgi:hypothetical protein